MSISETITKKFQNNLKATDRNLVFVKTQSERTDPIELTVEEKLEVLAETRSLMQVGHASGDWELVIEGVEHFCIFGALQRSLGTNPGDAGSTRDDAVSACSLTSTLFDAMPDGWRKQVAMEDIALWEGRLEEAARYDKGEAGHSLPDWAMSATAFERENGMLTGFVHHSISDAKVSALQSMNDSAGQDAVLSVLDEAVEKLRAHLATT